MQEHWPPITDTGINRNFWKIAVSTGLAGLGDQIALFSRIWASLGFGQRGIYVAPVLLAYSLPLVALMIFGGAIGARQPIRALIISGQLLAAVALVLGGILPLTPVVLMVCAFLAGVFDSVRSPTGQSVIALSVSPNHLYQANRIRQVQFQITRLAGPVIAGLLIATVGVHHTFLASAVLYFVGSWGLLGARLTVRRGAERGIDWSVIGRGWAVLRGRAGMLAMLAFYGFSNFAWLGPLQVGVPRLIRLMFHAGPTTLGIVNGSFGVGLLVGTLLAGRWPTLSSRLKFLFLFVAASDIVMGTAGLQDSSLGVAASFFCSGVAFAPVGPMFNTYVQERTPPDTMTSVLSFTSMALQGVQPLSILVSGLFSGVDPSTLFLAAGAIATVADILAYLWIGRALAPSLEGGTS